MLSSAEQNLWYDIYDDVLVTGAEHPAKQTGDHSRVQYCLQSQLVSRIASMILYYLLFSLTTEDTGVGSLNKINSRQEKIFK